MFKCIVKAKDGYQVEYRTHCDPKCIGHFTSEDAEDVKYIVVEENGDIKICKKLKSQRMKDQIKNAISE